MKVDFSYALETILPSKNLKRAIIAITNLCNSKCKTCTMWKNKQREELDFKHLEKFAEGRISKKIRFLTITGGEPLLRKDVDRIVNMFKKKNPKVHITILTNGLLPELTYEKVKNMPKDTLITLSFNGDEKAHDETRGVKGNFKNLLKTIDLLKSINQPVSLIFTVTPENYNQLLWAWNFAKKNNLNILFSPEMDYGRLNCNEGRGLNPTQKKAVLEQLTKIYAERKRGFFDYTYFLFFKKFYQNKPITSKCYAGMSSIYINYNGDVYPCENLVGRVSPFGNIKTKITIQKNYQEEVDKSKCYQNCYLICEMVRNLRRHPIKTYFDK
jgi:MoaA/NifB/PqqE/SkfB family radical SAM enzyme